MADVNVGYDGVQQTSARLKAGKTDMNEKLQSLKSMVDELVASDFMTRQASPQFQDSYQQWTTGARNMLEGLEGMAAFLDMVVSKHQELDADLASGASS
jgi:WXG100 family type VII secretion target